MSQPLLRLLFLHKGFNEIARTTMALLTASEVSSLLAALRIRPSSYFQKFLHPLRDVDPTLQTFEPWLRDKCQILIIGTDSLRLRDRILRPDNLLRKERPDPEPGSTERLDRGNLSRLSDKRRKSVPFAAPL